MNAPQSRFSNRVSDYIKYRPSYPAGLIDYLVAKEGLGKNTVIADIGSGTGKFTELVIDRVATVYGVEPNEPMRKAAEELLRARTNFVSIDGNAEATGLADKSVDFITVAQAFHWFRREETLREFRRIAKPGCKLALIWNNRKLDTSFLQTYDDALKSYATDYNEVNHQNLTEAELLACFSDGGKKLVFQNVQHFDWAGLEGRMLSSSYCPKPGEPNYDILMRTVRDAFDRYNSGGFVDFNYDAELYVGVL